MTCRYVKFVMPSWRSTKRARASPRSPATLCKPKSLLPWIVGLVVFSGEDPETGLIVGSAFQRGFSHEQNVKAWEKVGAVPLSRRCLSSPKVRRSIGDGTDNQQALVYLLVEHNTIACNALTLEGCNGDVMAPHCYSALTPRIATSASMGAPMPGRFPPADNCDASRPIPTTTTTARSIPPMDVGCSARDS